MEKERLDFVLLRFKELTQRAQRSTERTEEIIHSRKLMIKNSFR